jgi:hypothetical protein
MSNKEEADKAAGTDRLATLFDRKGLTQEGRPFFIFGGISV